MDNDKEGILRMIKALAFLFFIGALFFLVVSYSFLQEQIVIPGWELFSSHFPTRSDFFYYFLAGIVLVFIFYSGISRRLKRFPNRNESGVDKIFGFRLQSRDIKYWGGVWNAGIFLGMNLLIVGLILKIWQLNTPAMNTFSIGFTGTILLSFAVLVMAFCYPLLMIINDKKEENGNG